MVVLNPFYLLVTIEFETAIAVVLIVGAAVPVPKVSRICITLPLGIAHALHSIALIFVADLINDPILRRGHVAALSHALPRHGQHVPIGIVADAVGCVVFSRKTARHAIIGGGQSRRVVVVVRIRRPGIGPAPVRAHPLLPTKHTPVVLPVFVVYIPLGKQIVLRRVDLPVVDAAQVAADVVGIFYCLEGVGGSCRCSAPSAVCLNPGRVGTACQGLKIRL